jgi:hypothetical protein
MRRAHDGDPIRRGDGGSDWLGSVSPVLAGAGRPLHAPGRRFAGKACLGLCARKKFRLRCQPDDIRGLRGSVSAPCGQGNKARRRIEPTCGGFAPCPA